MGTYLLVALVGAVFGAAELLRGYRGVPVKIVLVNVASFVYCAINASASIITLLFIRELNLVDWADQSIEARRILEVLISGLGAATVLRVGLTFQLAGENHTISLMQILDPILDAADKVISDARHTHDMRAVSKIMNGLNEIQAFENLPYYCMKFGSRVTDVDTASIVSEIDKIRKNDMSEGVKVLSLGQTLIRQVGKNVLEEVVNAIKSDNLPPLSRERSQEHIDANSQMSLGQTVADQTSNPSTPIEKN